MRVPVQVAGMARHRRALGEDDWLIELSPSARSHRRGALPGAFAFRLIRYQRRGFRASYLLTSLLDAQRCSREELLALYHRRWQIETIYREWKHALSIQNLRSHTPAGLRREMYAHLLLSNLVRHVMSEAVCQTHTVPVQLSFTESLRLIGEALTDLLRCSPEERRRRYLILLQNIAAARIVSRPNRSYPRRREGRLRYKSNGKLRRSDRLPSP